MRYQRNKTYTLYFDSEDLEGLEIKTRGASLGIMLHAATLAGVLENVKGTPTADERAQLAELISLFAGCPSGCAVQHEVEAFAPGQHFTSRIKEWNFDDDEGHPLPPDYDGFADQDMDLQLAVILTWIDAVSGGSSGPLDEKSSDGQPSAAESIPMETLSAGQLF